MEPLLIAAAAKYAVNFAFTANRAVDVWKAVKKRSTATYNLYQQLQATVHPLRLCVQLRRRYATHEFVNAAVLMTQRTMAACQALLDGADADELGAAGPTSPGSTPASPSGRKPRFFAPPADHDWKRWLHQKKAGISRAELIPKLAGQLAQCHAALNLALTTVMVCTQELHRSARMPFEVCLPALRQAESIVGELEAGHTSRQALATGRVWVRVDGEWAYAFTADVAVEAFLSGGSAAVFLYVTEQEEGPQGSGHRHHGDCFYEAHDFSIDAGLHFKRTFLGDTELGGPDDTDTLAYLLGRDGDAQLALQFDGVDHLTAEVFEALLFMLVRTDGLTTPLADVLDLEHGIEGYASLFHSRVGPLRVGRDTETVQLRPTSGILTCSELADS